MLRSIIATNHPREERSHRVCGHPSGPPWINHCVLSLFREFLPQKHPACCSLMVAVPWGSAGLEKGVGKSWNYRIRETRNHRTWQWEGERFWCQIWAFGLPPPNQQQQTLQQLQGSLPAPDFWEEDAVVAGMRLQELCL